MRAEPDDSRTDVSFLGGGRGYIGGLEIQILLSWDLIRIFLTLHRTGGYETAAASLSMDSSTVRRKMQQLEARVGKAIFVRRDGRFEINENYQSLLDAALSMEAAAGSFSAGALTAQRSGQIRISMLDIFAQRLAGDLTEFMLKNPGIVLDITTEPHFVDLDRDMVDIAVRLARPMRGVHRMRKIANIGFGVYGTAGCIARSEKSGKYPVLALWPHFVHNDHEFDLARESWFHMLDVDCVVSGRTDNYPMLTSLCEQGAGLALLPHFLAAANPRLVQAFPKKVEQSVDTWLLVRRDVAKAQKIRAFVDFISQCFREQGCSFCHVMAAAIPGACHLGESHACHTKDCRTAFRQKEMQFPTKAAPGKQSADQYSHLV